MDATSRRRIRAARFVASGAAGAFALLSAGAGLAVEATTKAPVASAAAVAPVSATGTTISLGECHYEKTPAHDPQVRLECPAGQVVVAVYEHGIRCCVLELR